MEPNGTSALSETTPIKQVGIKAEVEEVGEERNEVLPASFNGRLNISSFAFEPTTSVKKESGSPTKTLRRTPQPSTPKGVTPKGVTPKGARPNGVTPQGKKRKPVATPSPSKRSRSASGYAPPSAYEHLPNLPDRILPNLIVLFIGLNPGIRTSTSGHAYAHPSNLFWKLLHSSGITPRKCHFTEDVDLPRLWALGNTNIVARPTRNGSELSTKEMDEGVAALEEKIRTNRPEAVCIVGKSIWESIWRVRHKRSLRKEEFKYGWQDESENMGKVDDGAWSGARVFAATSTSGLAATTLPAEKERIWRELGEWVEKRRFEREHVRNENTHFRV